MRNIVIITLMILIITQSLYAQESQAKANQISVIGSVELKAIADQASFTFEMKGVGSSLRDAVEDANKKVLDLTNKLQSIGLSQNNISTSQFYSGENYGDKAFLSSSRDFQALLVTQIKIDSLPLLDTVLYTISESEVENLSNIYFSLKDELDLRKKARIAAAMKAKEKAEDISRALGVTLGPVINIDELEPTKSVNQSSTNSFLRSGRITIVKSYPNHFNPPSSPNVIEQPTFDESRGSGFFAQTISMTSQVRVTFGIR